MTLLINVILLAIIGHCRVHDHKKSYIILFIIIVLIMNFINIHYHRTPQMEHVGDTNAVYNNVK